MFAIYLLHTNRIGFSFIKYAEHQLLGYRIPLCLTYVITASVIFIFCVLLDIPRSLLLIIFDTWIRKILDKIDFWYNWVIIFIERC